MGTLGLETPKWGLEDQKRAGKAKIWTLGAKWATGDQHGNLEAPKGQNRRRDHVDSPTTGDRHGNLCGRSVVGSES